MWAEPRRRRLSWLGPLLLLATSCRASAERDGAAGERAAAQQAPSVNDSVVNGAAGTTPARAAQSAAPRAWTHERACLGTKCTFVVFHDDGALVERAVQAAFAEIERLDALMTTWTPDSEVSRINAAAGTGVRTQVSPETFVVLERSLWIAERSRGAFDVTVGAFQGLWKFDQDNDGSIPSERDVRARKALVDYRGLELDPEQRAVWLSRAGQRITLGGIAKGYIVDRAVAVLRESGLVNFLVQSGGDLYAAGHHGERPWRVGIQDPRAPRAEGQAADSSFALIELSDAAFNTSGDYERFVLKNGRRYHHILDPRTGFPVRHTRSVTVLAPTSFLADTVDTAVFVMGVKDGLALIESLPGVEALIVDGRNGLHQSSGLSGTLRILRLPSDGP